MSHYLQHSRAIHVHLYACMQLTRTSSEHADSKEIATFAGQALLQVCCTDVLTHSSIGVLPAAPAHEQVWHKLRGRLGGLMQIYEAPPICKLLFHFLLCTMMARMILLLLAFLASLRRQCRH